LSRPWRGLSRPWRGLSRLQRGWTTPTARPRRSSQRRREWQVAPAVAGLGEAGFGVHAFGHATTAVAVWSETATATPSEWQADGRRYRIHRHPSRLFVFCSGPPVARPGGRPRLRPTPRSPRAPKGFPRPIPISRLFIQPATPEAWQATPRAWSSTPWARQATPRAWQACLLRKVLSSYAK
jgi:hypothetical protein